MGRHISAGFCALKGMFVNLGEGFVRNVLELELGFFKDLKLELLFFMFLMNVICLVYCVCFRNCTSF